MKPEVTLYTRAGCCLCDEAKQVIAAARLHADFDYAEIDIDANPDLVRLYNDEVPCRHHQSKESLQVQSSYQ